MPARPSCFVATGNRHTLRVVARSFLPAPALLLALAYSIALASGQETAAETGRLIRANTFDASACYRVRDLKIVKEDLSIYLTSGYLMLAKKVNGVRPAALFTADVEAGDAEVLLMPPDRSERLSLASFAGVPNLDEHFRTSLMIFTDNTGAELERQMLEGAESRGDASDAKKAELMSRTWNPVLQNLSTSFDVRIVQDLVSPGAAGFFYMGLVGTHIGSFDVSYDPTSADQIVVGQISERKGEPIFDTWTAFDGRNVRTSAKPRVLMPAAVADYSIDADLDAALAMRAVTRVKVTPTARSGRALPFLISDRMKVTAVTIDGEPAEVYQTESVRSTLIRGGGDQAFLVLPKTALKTGQTYNFEFHHEGSVISEAGKGVYFVGARGTWYPHEPEGLSRFDLTFHLPRTFDLVATGSEVDKSTAGDKVTLHFRADQPIRFAGFNLGKYERKCITKNGFTLEVCANAPADSGPDALHASAPRLQEIAESVIAALEYYSAELGPPPVRTLTVSPIPDTFGQGFPGLIYLSTLAYLDPQQRPAEMRADKYSDFFFSDLMAAHETAHQWWGNLVAPATPRDSWIMEALANYCALMYLEDRKGGAIENVLNSYRQHLTMRAADGRMMESAGPITWGVRLSTSEFPDGWRLITYEKGSWIIHMLRLRMGDDNFRRFMAELCRRYRFQSLGTEDFRRVATEFVPAGSPDAKLESFFDTWVYGTGIPELKLRYAVRGTRVTGTVTQSGVDDQFSAFVPVEVELGQKRVVHWVETGSDPAQFSWVLKEKPVRVSLPSGATLATIQD